MKTVSLDTLATDFPAVEEIVQRGEEVIVARDGKPVVRILPPEPVMDGSMVQMPDYAARMREVFGDKQPGNFVDWYVTNR